MAEKKLKVVVGVDPIETRVAVLKDGILDGFFIERLNSKDIRGNIYCGRVVKVLPGIRAAFVNIGLERDGFLPSTQVLSREILDAIHSGNYSGVSGSSDSHKFEKVQEEKTRKRKRGTSLIEKSIHEGEEIKVQVIDVPKQTKGVKVTTYISIPGRYLVFMPTIIGVGVSRRIRSGKERARLREIGGNLIRSLHGGVIIRSASEGVSEEIITGEANYLKRRWENGLNATSGRKPPYLILEEIPLPEKVLRDLSEREVEEVIVDDFNTYTRIEAYLRKAWAGREFNLKFWDNKRDLFQAVGIEEKIDSAFARKVKLPSGGFIVIDQAEALTAIDVNTGSFTGGKDAERTILTTNMEAVREVAYQLRLRGIGGLVILDLIDMEKEEHKESVYRELLKSLRHDKAKVSVRKISDMGLIEMTREHYGSGVIRLLHENCWYCDGTGSVMSRDAICARILRNLISNAKTRHADLQVTAHQSIVLKMEKEFSKYLYEIEKLYNLKIFFNPRVDVHIEYFSIQNT